MKKIIEKNKNMAKSPKACIQRNQKYLILEVVRKDRQIDDTRSEGRQNTRPEMQSAVLVRRESPNIDTEQKRQ